MPALWTSENAAAAIGGKTSSSWKAQRVSIDSRDIQPGDLFVALKGPNRDGHDFVGDALARGAAAALVSHVPDGLSEDRLLIAQDTQKGLEALARAARARTRARVISVTGSVGKTTTKEMLGLVLAAFGKTHLSIKSYNNQWGVPLSLANLPEEAAYGVFEVGMNHAGEISALTEILRPDVSLITAIAPVHLEFFKSVDDIARAKAEIFESMTENGIAILNRESEQFRILEQMAQEHGIRTILSFGQTDGSTARLVDYALDEDGSAATANIAGRHIKFMLSVPGRHFIMNALAVLLAVQALGEDPQIAADALKSFQALGGRGRQKTVALPDGGTATLIDESYNANPLAMVVAFDVLGQKKSGRKIAVLGDMLELGPGAPKLHEGLADALVKNGIDLVFTCGPLMQNLHQALPPDKAADHAADSAALAPMVAKALKAGDNVLVKGSLGSRMKVIVDMIENLVAESKGGARHAV